MREFKTESTRLLDLTINSIYTNRDIFLRELVSNASDALDKLASAMRAGDAAGAGGAAGSEGTAGPEGTAAVGVAAGVLDGEELGIHIHADRESRTLVISDNGIGMTEEGLDRNLGTIAYSGSLAFKRGADGGTGEGEAAGAGGAAGSGGSASAGGAASSGTDIIGQFGIGFYSAFMAADRVRVVSRAWGGDRAFQWESDGVSGYTIEPAERSGRGTDVILHIRESDRDNNYERYLDTLSLKQLVKRYSNYIRYPISIDLVEEVPDLDATAFGSAGPVPTKTVTRREVVNSMVPIWAKRDGEVGEEEYVEFFQAEFRETTTPLLTLPIHDDELGFDALLFVPRSKNADPTGRLPEAGPALYSANVLIAEHAPDMLPGYLGFIRGVVSTGNLPLNVSREVLQEDPAIGAIAKRLEERVLEGLAGMLDERRDDYLAFFDEFGPYLKHAINTSYGMLTEDLHDLLVYPSAREHGPITLGEYVDAERGGDRTREVTIYYATGEDPARIARTPSVRAMRNRGHDVLLCPGAMGDEICFQTMKSYKGTPFACVSGADVNVAGAAERTRVADAAEKNAALFRKLAGAAPAAIARAVPSLRLIGPHDAASCIVAGGNFSIAMAKYLQEHRSAQGPRSVEYTLEVNVGHRLFRRLKSAHSAGDDKTFRALATLLAGEAMLAEDLDVDDAQEFIEAANALIE